VKENKRKKKKIDNVNENARAHWVRRKMTEGKKRKKKGVGSFREICSRAISVKG
jgi:hypothetical protein